MTCSRAVLFSIAASLNNPLCDAHETYVTQGTNWVGRNMQMSCSWLTHGGGGLVGVVLIIRQRLDSAYRDRSQRPCRQNDATVQGAAR